MRTLLAATVSRRLLLNLSILALFSAHVVSAETSNHERTGGGTSAGLRPPSSRLVASAPGIEIRADERNYFTRVLMPITANEPAGATDLPAVFATIGSSAVTPPPWRPLPLYGGTVARLAVSPADPNFVLAGAEFGPTNTGTLFQSDDGGVTWSAIYLAADPRLTGRIEDIDFTADGTAYVVVENKLIRQDPGTGAWTTVAEQQYARYHQLGVNPGDPNEIWLAGYYQLSSSAYYLQRSRDAGVTWENVTPPVGANRRCTGIAFKTADPRIVVAAFSFNGGEVWRSPDGGETWTREATLTSNYTDVVYDGSRFVVSAEWLNTAGVFASSDDGLTWRREDNSQWPSRQVYDLDVDPRQPGVVLASTRRGLFRCNGGQWEFRVGGMSTELRSACLFSGDPERILVGQAGEGVLRSVDGGTSFSASSTGLLAVDAYSLACHPNNPNEMAASFQGVNSGGVCVSRDGGQTWTFQNLLPARYEALAYAPDGTLYVASRGPTDPLAPEGVYRRNANDTWTALGPFVGANYDTDVQCIRVDPTNARNIILVGEDYVNNNRGIWRSTDAGAHWTRVFSGPWEFSFKSGAQFINDGTGMKVLATTPLGGALYSEDGGATWAPVTGLPGSTRGSHLQGTPADPGTFYLAGSGRPNGYRSRDGGKTWSPFQVPGDVSAIEVDLVNPDFVYAATTGSQLVRSQNGGNQFNPFNDGCPTVFGNDFAWIEAPCPTLLFANHQGVFARDIDAVAPRVSLELEPNVLWPPDHKLRTIHARVTATDACDSSPAFALTSITAEDETGAPRDIVAEIGEGVTTFQLRAERPGQGERRYLVTYVATDASGNTSEATTTVVVPHDQAQAVLIDHRENSRAGSPMKTGLVGIEPNPFNPSTSAMLTLARTQHVTLDVYDVRGARVRTLVSCAMPAGTHRIAWDGTDQSGRPAASGVYFFRFAAGAHAQTMKALLIK